MLHIHYLQYTLILAYLMVRIPFLMGRAAVPLKILAELLAVACFVPYNALMAAGLVKSWDSVSTLLGLTGFLFSTASFFTLLLFLADVLGLPNSIRRRLFPRRGHGLFVTGAPPGGRSPGVPLVLFAASLLLAGWGTWQARRAPVLESVEITIPRLPETLDGMRIAQLSDLHLSPFFPRERVVAYAERVNALDPDLILITGDVADGTVEAREADMEFLDCFKKRSSVVVIPGNHEYHVNYEAWREFYRKVGVKYLENRNTHFYVRDELVTVAGVTDAAAERGGRELPNVEKALVMAGEDSLRILLDHRPVNAVANSDPKWGFDLQLSGHTHGSQVIAMYPLVHLANEGFVRGLFHVGPMALYVSRGAGLWSGFPARIGSPAEITLITLRSPAKAN